MYYAHLSLQNFDKQVYKVALPMYPLIPPTYVGGWGEELFGVLCVSSKKFEIIFDYFNYVIILIVKLPLVKVTKLAKKQGDNKRLKTMKQNDFIRQIETCLPVRRCGEHQRACISDYHQRWMCYLL